MLMMMMIMQTKCNFQKRWGWAPRGRPTQWAPWGRPTWAPRGRPKRKSHRMEVAFNNKKSE